MIFSKGKNLLLTGRAISFLYRLTPIEKGDKNESERVASSVSMLIKCCSIAINGKYNRTNSVDPNQTDWYLHPTVM